MILRRVGSRSASVFAIVRSVCVETSLQHELERDKRHVFAPHVYSLIRNNNENAPFAQYTHTNTNTHGAMVFLGELCG